MPGISFPDSVNKLRASARSLDMEDRLIIEETDSYLNDVMSISDIATSRLGLDLRKPISYNYKYAAFATNKLHQYMTAGIPTVARNGPGYNELAKLLGTGICVDMNSSEQITSAINQILGNENVRTNLG